MFEEADLQSAGKHFAIVGPPVSEAGVDTIFSGSFPGKEDLVKFYLRYNGGGRTPQGCVISCGNPAHKVSRDHLDKIKIEGFMSVSHDAKDRMLPFRPILGHHAAMSKIHSEIPEMKEFLEQNIPFAFDHTGEDICINLVSGSVWFIDWEEYRKGPIELSPSFRDFVLRYWVNAEYDACS
jgi:SMI1 / KNR4 family (SUKH-1)